MPQRKTSIFVVDDDDIDAMAIERAYLKVDPNCMIYRAVDGIEAINMLTGENGAVKIPEPNFILVDINMPRMNGIKFIKLVREHPQLKNSIIFVLTTSKNEADRNAAYDLRIAGYIVKDNIDSNYNKLVETLDNLCTLITFP